MQVPTFIGSGSNTGQLINLAIALGLLVGAVIALVLLVRYVRARGVTNRMHELFPGGVVLTVRSSNELHAALARLEGTIDGEALKVPRYLTVVVDNEGVAFWVPMPFRDQATLDDKRLRLIPWAQVRTIEAGTAFLERPVNSVVVVASQFGTEIRVEFVPHQTGFFGGMGYDGGSCAGSSTCCERSGPQARGARRGALGPERERARGAGCARGTGARRGALAPPWLAGRVSCRAAQIRASTSNAGRRAGPELTFRPGNRPSQLNTLTFRPGKRGAERQRGSTGPEPARDHGASSRLSGPVRRRTWARSARIPGQFGLSGPIRPGCGASSRESGPVLPIPGRGFGPERPFRPAFSRNSSCGRSNRPGLAELARMAGLAELAA